MQPLRFTLPFGLAMPLTAVLLAGAVSVSLSAKRQPPSPAPGLTLTASAWNIRYSAGLPAHPSPLAGMSGWWVNLPVAPGSLNYLTTPYTTPMPQDRSVTFTAQIVATDGTPVFNFMLEPWNTCNYPAHVRAYFEQQAPKGCPDATYTCAPATARWWANPIAVELAAGVVTVTVPLTPEQWSDAEGEIGSAQLAGFATALGHPAAIGLTFGGGCFFGHGVNVSGGTARFILLNYVVQ